jgi:hypothetical protein
LEISNSAEVGLMQDEQGRAELSHSSMSRDRVNTDVGRENNGSSRESTPDSRRSTSSDRSTNAEAEWPNRAGTQAARAHTETAAGAGVKSGGMHVSPPVHHVGSQPMDIKPGLGGAHRPTGSGGAGVGSAGASPVLGGSLKKTTSVAAPRPALKAYALKVRSHWKRPSTVIYRAVTVCCWGFQASDVQCCIACRQVCVRQTTYW